MEVEKLYLTKKYIEYNYNSLISKKRNILIENPTFIINNYIKFKGVTCEHGNISIRKMNGQIINNNCFLFENELNCEIIEDFVGKVNIYLGEKKLDSTYISNSFSEAIFETSFKLRESQTPSDAKTQ